MERTELRRMTIGNSADGHMSMSEMNSLIDDLSMRVMDDVSSENITAVDGQRMIARNRGTNPIIYLNSKLERYVYCEGNNPRQGEANRTKLVKKSVALFKKVFPERWLSPRRKTDMFWFANMEDYNALTVDMVCGNEHRRFWKNECQRHRVATTDGSEKYCLYYEGWVETGYHFEEGLYLPDGVSIREIADPDYEAVRGSLHQINNYHWGKAYQIFRKVIYAENEERTPHLPTYGVEIETRNDRSQEAINTVDFTDAWWHLERDSTVQGFECISRPLTYNAWVEKYPMVVNMFRKMTQYGITSHDAPVGDYSYGLHVHIGRKSFINDNAIYTFVGMIHAFKQPLVKLARRENSTYASWWGEGNTRTLADVKDRYPHAPRHSAVNVTNRNTIEVRIFKGTLNATTFMATLEILDKMVAKANEIVQTERRNLSTVNWQDFCGGRFELGTRSGERQFPLDLDQFSTIWNVADFMITPEMRELQRQYNNAVNGFGNVAEMINRYNANPDVEERIDIIHLLRQYPEFAEALESALRERMAEAQGIDLSYQREIATFEERAGGNA